MVIESIVRLAGLATLNTEGDKLPKILIVDFLDLDMCCKIFFVNLVTLNTAISN